MAQPRACLTFWALVCAAIGASSALAAVPATVPIAGTIASAGGGPAPDGDYALSFAIYALPQGGATAWKEGPIVVTVKSGVFQVALGAVNPLPQAVLAALPEAWLGVAIGNDPELPRRTIGSTVFALRAAKAEGLDCSGCVGAAHIDPKALADFAKTADLTAYVQASALAKVAASGDYKDLVNPPKLADVAKSGQFLDLVDAPVIAKVGTACGTGLFVKGLKADGSLECADGGVSVANLPKDGLDEISNGTLTNQFQEVAASTKTPIDIADASPAGVNDIIDMPEVGVAQTLAISVDIANSDISKLRVTLYDPNGASYKLHDQTGSGGALKATFAATDKLVAGDLSPWIGKSVKGIWSLTVADLAGTFGAKDGKLNGWFLTVGAVAASKVAAKGALIAEGGLRFPVAASAPWPCDGSRFGFAWANSKDKALYFCNGSAWIAVSLQDLGTVANPATSCKAILAQSPGSKDGLYWIAPGNVAPFQAWCDMGNAGGGWTLAARMVGGSWCHVDINAAGLLAAPNQPTCAKLADATIRSLYTDQFWLNCGSVTPNRWGKIDNINNFNLSSPTGNKKMTWSQTYGGTTYSGTDNACCNFGDYDYGSPAIIYSISTSWGGGNYKSDWSGCYNSKEGWHQSGFLYVR